MHGLVICLVAFLAVANGAFIYPYGYNPIIPTTYSAYQPSTFASFHPKTYSAFHPTTYSAFRPTTYAAYHPVPLVKTIDTAVVKTDSDKVVVSPYSGFAPFAPVGAAAPYLKSYHGQGDDGSYSYGYFDGSTSALNYPITPIAKFGEFKPIEEIKEVKVVEVKEVDDEDKFRSKREADPAFYAAIPHPGFVTPSFPAIPVVKSAVNEKSSDTPADTTRYEYKPFVPVQTNLQYFSQFPTVYSAAHYPSASFPFANFPAAPFPAATFPAASFPTATFPGAPFPLVYSGNHAFNFKPTTFTQTSFAPSKIEDDK